MVRITTLDSTEESTGIVKRKDLEEDAMTDNSEHGSEESPISKENILKDECSMDDSDDEKPNCPEETKEQRNGDRHDEKYLNNIINSLTVHNHNAKEENEQSFSYCNLFPEQPKMVTQVDSKELLTKSAVNKKDVTKELVSPSLQYLSELNKPKELTDGAVASICRLDDMFMFPQDNRNISEPKTIAKLPSHTNTNHKNTKQELAMSKSLDSHRTSLEKGCKLLETKPFKSSLTRGRSEECLKKYVHFPEDIRNIRKVFKYESLDDMIFLKTDKDEDETNE